jgi:hypothetical protein
LIVVKYKVLMFVGAALAGGMVSEATTASLAVPPTPSAVLRPAVTPSSLRGGFGAPLERLRSSEGGLQANDGL